MNALKKKQPCVLHYDTFPVYLLGGQPCQDVEGLSRDIEPYLFALKKSSSWYECFGICM